MGDREKPDDARRVEANFVDLKRKLRAFVDDAQPTDDDLHFATFQSLDHKSLAELTRLAHEGRTRVSDQGDYFLNQELYGDGMYWYDLFLVISSAALCYRTRTGQSPAVDEVETLARTLVLISRYSAQHPSDIRKRNQEALGNLLWSTHDPELLERIIIFARGNDAMVVAFVQETAQLVRDSWERGPEDERLLTATRSASHTLPWKKPQ